MSDAAFRRAKAKKNRARRKSNFEDLGEQLEKDRPVSAAKARVLTSSRPSSAARPGSALSTTSSRGRRASSGGAAAAAALAESTSRTQIVPPIELRFMYELRHYTNVAEVRPGWGELDRDLVAEQEVAAALRHDAAKLRASALLRRKEQRDEDRRRAIMAFMEKEARVSVEELEPPPAMDAAGAAAAAAAAAAATAPAADDAADAVVAHAAEGAHGAASDTKGADEPKPPEPEHEHEHEHEHHHRKSLKKGKKKRRRPGANAKPKTIAGSLKPADVSLVPSVVAPRVPTPPPREPTLDEKCATWESAALFAAADAMDVVAAEALPKPFAHGAIVRGAVLEALELEGSGLTGRMPPSVGVCATLQRLVLRHNRLGGALPASLGMLGCLTTLRMDHNVLTGSIPPEIGACEALTTLDLSNNNLRGRLTPTIGRLTKLRELDLQHNRLSGELAPATFAGLTQLRVLRLNNNLLHGPLPRSIAMLRELRTCWLHHNKLGGELPVPALRHMSQLRQLWLHGNAFEETEAARQQLREVFGAELQVYIDGAPGYAHWPAEPGQVNKKLPQIHDAAKRGGALLRSIVKVGGRLGAPVQPPAAAAAAAAAAANAII
jgi:hypothetical protein